MRLVKSNADIPILNEKWTIEFYDHKPLDFATREDLEKYLRHVWIYMIQARSF